MKRDNPIVQENANTGTTEWQLQYTRFDDPITMASYPLIRRLRSFAIEGYASQNSIFPGEKIDLFISLSPPGSFVIDIYRMGYYRGAGARHVTTLGHFKGFTQPMPMMGMERLRECNWEKAVTLAVPDDWASGVYLAKLTRDEPFGVQSYIIFVVKADRAADLIFQCSDLTWQAYNKWPGKNSLYDDGTTELWYTGPNVRVGFDRPYAKYSQVYDAPGTVGSGSFLLWEHPLAYWLEQQGYDVIYSSNVDLHLGARFFETAKVFISVGHDEYWSREMLDAATKARDEGLSFAFLSGNTVFHDVIFYSGSWTGFPCRAFARKRLHGGEEAKLTGLVSYGPGYGDWIVAKPEHWIFSGLDLEVGARIPAIIGWEYNGTPAELPNLEVVATSPLFPRSNEYSSDQRHTAVVYRGAKGNWVFNAGTIWWSEGLSFPPGHIPARVGQFAGTFGVSPSVQKITANFLDRAIKDSPRS